MAPGIFQITQKLFLVRDDTFLVLREGPDGTGDLPGGRFDPGEIFDDWSEALRREIAEELGAHVVFDLEPAPRFLFPHRIRVSGYEALGIAWVGRWRSGDVALSDEHQHAAWVPLQGWDPATWFVETQLDAVRRFLADPDGA